MTDADRLLEARVRPPGWRAPAPRARYDLVVVGGGTGGLVAAALAAGLGATVALVERHRLGGDCLNTGCVPSKSLLASAARGLGFPEAIARMRETRAALAAHDSAERFAGLGVDVFFGTGRFVARDAVEIDGATRLAFRRAVVATGGRPVVPEIPGLAEIDPLTSDTAFDLAALPARLAVVGAGAVGCELAQAFARLGSAVALLEAEPRVLPAEEPEAAAVVAAALARDGVDVRAGARVERAERSGAGARLVVDGAPLEVDRVLVAASRAPALEGLDLEAAGIAREGAAVRVDAGLRTTNRRVWAVGDCVPGPGFTHRSEAHARIAVRNALFPGRRRADRLRIPRAVYTDPELGALGHTAATAAGAGLAVDVHEVAFAAIDRAALEGETDGFARVLARRGSREIVGATVVGAAAGEVVAALALALEAGADLATLSEAVLPYPTRTEAWKRVGDAASRTRLTPAAARWIARWLRLSRRLG